MIFSCADCDCVFDREERTTACNSPACCCNPATSDSLDNLAQRVASAIDASDLAAVGDLLAPTASWGAPGETGPTCSSRHEVLEWCQQMFAQGIRASVFETLVVDGRVVVGMHVTQDNEKPEDGDRQWQVLTTANNLIVDIRPYESRESALLAASTLDERA